MSVIARTLMVLTDRVHGSGAAECQFKNAIMTLAAEAAILVPDDPQRAIQSFSEILNAILARQILPAQISQADTAQSHEKTPQQMVRRQEEKA